jgi:hypothetical protein
MQEIKLNEGYITLVDDDDYEWLCQWKWYVRHSDKTDYVIRTAYHKGVYKTVSMHREIMHSTKGQEVDHIDHNGLNNQKLNLRNCSKSQNQSNSSGRIRRKSIYKGVNYKKDPYSNHSRFVAQIQINKKKVHIGSFKTEIEAAYAYDKKAKELFGEYATLNFPN